MRHRWPCAAEVALEAGNSPQMIFKHYRELVTEKAAKAWFAITPEVAKARREVWEAEFRAAAERGKREAKQGRVSESVSQ